MNQMEEIAMIHLTGEMFVLSGGRRMLIHNEQNMRLSVGEAIVYQDQIYVITGFEHSSSPNGLWALQLEKDGIAASQNTMHTINQQTLTNKEN